MTSDYTCHSPHQSVLILNQRRKDMRTLFLCQVHSRITRLLLAQFIRFILTEATVVKSVPNVHGRSIQLQNYLIYRSSVTTCRNYRQLSMVYIPVYPDRIPRYVLEDSGSTFLCKLF